jgi:threonyl-tRNA synthetase
VRRLGDKKTSVESLDAVTQQLGLQATPPDLL